jgi:aminotransferase
MALGLSKRASLVVRSEIRNMSVECERAGGINLAQGVCDTELPPVIARAAKDAIDAGINAYTRHDGLVQLRSAIARKLKSYNGLYADPDKEVVVTGGSTGAFYCACMALLDDGDEVILFEPFYGYHLNTLMAMNVVPKFVRMTPPDWHFDEAALKAAITPRTRGVMVNTPANPAGKVWTRAELALVADVAREHDMFVFTDEIYEYFLYDDRKHVSPASLPQMADRTITISGVSKTFSITGWRIGYAVAKERFSRMIGYMNDLVYVCAPAPLQDGVARGMEVLDESYYRGLRAEYQKKRDKVCGALQTAGLTPYLPQGAYYVLADATRLPGANSREKAMHLLREAGVATVPGEAFFHDHGGDNLIRICYAKPDPQLDEACLRLERRRF